ncbi:MAG: hypothetical protein EOP89_13045, partial [Lysobacteraceae bacterium]
NSSFATQSAGVATVDLRNLGVDRTLVLVNGRRFVSGVPGSNAVDAQVAQVDGGDARALRREAGVGAADRRRAEGRVLEQQVLDVDRARLLDLLGADDLERRGRGSRGGGDA